MEAAAAAAAGFSHGEVKRKRELVEGRSEWAECAGERWRVTSLDGLQRYDPPVLRIHTAGHEMTV